MEWLLIVLSVAVLGVGGLGLWLWIEFSNALDQLL
jgi:hypothetical protein